MCPQVVKPYHILLSENIAIDIYPLCNILNLTLDQQKCNKTEVTPSVSVFKKERGNEKSLAQFFQGLKINK